MTDTAIQKAESSTKDNLISKVACTTLHEAAAKEIKAEDQQVQRYNKY